MNEPKTRFDKFDFRIKNNPIVASLIVLGTIVIALSTFTDAAKNLLGLVVKETRPEINGEWRAEVTYDWPDSKYAETFTFGGDGDDVHGTASLLGEKRGILEGKVRKDRLQFTTKTQEVLQEWNNPRVVVNRYHGKVFRDEIKFILQMEGGSSEHIPIEFTARKVPNPATSTNLFSPEVARELDASIREIVIKNNLPSVAVKVSAPGKREYAFVAGYSNLETHLARTLESPFRIASITKPFAATAVLILVDRGLLDRSDRIAKWYPQFPNANQITVDDLLRMRSGIPAPNDDEVLAQVYDAPLKAVPSLADNLASIARLKIDFKPPNTVGVYTDFNYDILAGIVQRVTGKDIGQLITETVIVPLKLHDTSYPTGTGIPGPLRGYGWDPVTKQFDDKTLFNPPLAGASGAVISSIPDLQMFSRALCKGELLLPQTQKERMQGQPLVGSDAQYGEGVAFGFGFCGHSGTINGFSTDMYYVEKLDASLVISVNQLDRDNKSQSSPILDLLTRALVPSLGAK